MADIIIEGGTAITMDEGRRIIEDSAIVIEGSRIIAVGERSDVRRHHDAARIIDARRMVVLPGLIDAHAHAGHGLIKTMGMEQGNHWEEICGEVYTRGSTPEFWYAEARLAALERLRFGVTTGVSLLGGGDTIMRTDDPAYADAHCAGVREVGTRAVLAVGPTRPPHPLIYAEWSGNERRDYPVDFARQFETCRSILRYWHDRDRIRVALLTPVLRDEHVSSLGPSLLDEAIEQTRKVYALAQEHGVIFTQDGHRKGSVARAAEIGTLGPASLFSHAIDLTDEEIALCADSGTRIAHNPSAVASMLGRCPVTELLDAGAIVALGSDATAPDRSADMFRHMQQCMHYHRTFHRDPSVLPPGKVLEMATIDAAMALGMADEIGSLEAGKKADVILVDMARPHLHPVNMEAFRVVYFANGNDVHTVIVDGEIVLEGRLATRVDEDGILQDAQRECDLMIERTGTRAMIGMPEGFFGHTRYPKGRGQ